MGLDMYAFAINAQDAGDTQVDIVVNDKEGNKLFPVEEIFYWRKFNALHGWMEDLYRLKGGTDKAFNCNTVRLDAKDLDRLEMDTGNNKLVPRNGFFFGSQEIYPEDIESVARFVAKARQAIAEDKVVFYDSWW